MPLMAMFSSKQKCDMCPAMVEKKDLHRVSVKDRDGQSQRTTKLCGKCYDAYAFPLLYPEAERYQGGETGG